MIQRLALAALAVVVAVPLSGCLVTAPVKAAAWGVDKVTTSQAEADRKRGAEIRKREKFCRKHPDRC
jgi:hypothetical protein